MFGASCSREDRVMKVKGRDNWSAKLTCFTCGLKGHKAAECASAGERRGQRQWCSLCKSATHKDANCHRRKRDEVKQAVDEEDHTFAFKVQLDAAAPTSAIRIKGLMVDSGATKHIITDMERFEEFDSSFQPKSHILELADGERTSGIALKKGTAKVRMRDNKGRDAVVMLQEALYVPSFSQDIFSIKAATAQGATVIFKEGQNRLIHKNGTIFDINTQDRMFYLSTLESDTDQCSVCYDVQTWHKILGYCNYDDVLKLESVTEGMKIKGKDEKSNLKCEVCIQGKFAQSRNT